MKSTILLLFLITHMVGAIAGFSLFGIRLFGDSQFKDNFQQANEHFAIRLMNILEQNANGTANVFISPFSIGLCLAMVMAGAGGDTYTQIKHTLGFPKSLSTDDIATGYRQLLPELAKNNVSIANAILIENRSQLVSDYHTTLETNFESEIFKTDPNEQTTVERINKWVSEKTHGNIRGLLSAIPTGMGAILLNTIYFSSLWVHKLLKNPNKSEFYTQPDSFKLVDFMSGVKMFNYGKYDDGELVELQYRDKSVSMFAFLPAQNIKTSLSSLFDKSSPGKTLSVRIGQMELSRTLIRMPLLKLSTNYTLNGALTKMGIVQAFKFNADFSGIIEGLHRLRLTKVLHRTMLEVTENGTTALAVTASVTRRISGQQSEPLTAMVIFNRPFVLFIRDNSNGVVLFSGVINHV